MKAITCKYHGPTNTKGSRITAEAEGGPRPHRVSISYPHELSGEAVYAAAAIVLCRKLGWTGELIGGGATKPGVWVFVFAHGDRWPIDAPAEVQPHA